MAGTQAYRICSRCIMDNALDPTIVFDEKGVCNHCRRYDLLAKNVVVADEAARQEFIDKIKASGRGKRYDSIIGMSGGTDSTYVAYLAKQWGLRPLAVSVDNGWDDPRAQQNVKNAVQRLGFDFNHWVLDPEEFKDLQLAYLKASVIGIELITDHIIFAVLFDLADRHGVKYILSGSNVVTEGLPILDHLEHDMHDVTNMRDIHAKFGKARLRTLPMMGPWKRVYYSYVKGIRYVAPLNYVRYVKSEAKETLKREVGWQDYGTKHYESIWTRFYQGCILPTKFGFDKRRLFLSTLINSGQTTREAARREMEQPAYPPEQLAQDKKIVLEGFGLTEQEFEDLMKLPVRRHDEFKTSGMWTSLRRLNRWLHARRRRR